MKRLIKVAVALMIGGVLATGCPAGKRNRPRETKMLTFDKVSAETAKMALGRSHTCVLKDGDVYCIGKDKAGQLGFSDYVSPTAKGPVRQKNFGKLIPVFKPTGVSGYMGVAAGGVHTTVLSKEEHVYNFGEGKKYQVPPAMKQTPAGEQQEATKAVNFEPQRLIAPAQGERRYQAVIGTGRDYSIAQDRDGRAVLWGQIKYLKLQEPGFKGKKLLTVPTIFTDNKKDVFFKPGSLTASWAGFCGILSRATDKINAGKAVCVGNNKHGQFGENTLDGVLTAIPIENVEIIRTGGYQLSKAMLRLRKGDDAHTLVITNRHELFAAGSAGEGQLFLTPPSSTMGSLKGVKDIKTFTPVTFGKEKDLKFIGAALTAEGSFVLTNDGQLYFAGLSESGEAADGDPEKHSIIVKKGKALKPIFVWDGDEKVVKAWKGISASFEHACAEADDGKFYTWGANTFGETNRMARLGPDIIFPFPVEFSIDGNPQKLKPHNYAAAAKKAKKEAAKTEEKK